MNDDRETAFSASENTPGQRDSRSAYQRLRDRLRMYPWAEVYLELRGEGWTWRKAVYIAWESMPKQQRQPETQRELATEVLGLRSSHTISKWKRKQPEILDAIAEQQAAPLLEYRASVFEALGKVASMVDPRAKPDRQLFLEMTGDYKARQAVEMSNEDGEAFEVNFDVSGLPDHVLRAIADGEASSSDGECSAQGVEPPASD